jgi:5-methylcytosine-specific restriction endonuclease McrA
MKHAKTRWFIQYTNDLICGWLYFFLLPKANEEKIKKIRVNASKRKNNKQWKDIQKQLIQSPCQLCGSQSEAVHHIIPVCVEPKLQCELSNLMPLCKKCHRKQHPELSSILFE